VGFFSSEEECFIFTQDKCLLNATRNLFSWLHKEALGASHQDLFSKLVHSVLVNRIQNVTELVLLQNGNVPLLELGLIDINDMTR
jgi:hypothetical protein